MEDLSGNSVFWRERDAEIYLAYQSFGRGGEDSMGIYRLFDMLPLGREEHGPNHSLTDWAKLRNRYDEIPRILSAVVIRVALVPVAGEWRLDLNRSLAARWNVCSAAPCRPWRFHEARTTADCASGLTSNH
jgi:hypothetical protein